jgi:Arc/MetJ-type ribon-helix-helix transcriptional regulator
VEAEKMNQKKAEVRVFLDGVHLKIIDDLIPSHGNTRSEVIRTLIHEWLGTNVDKLKEWQRLSAEAASKGYVPKKRG